MSECDTCNNLVYDEDYDDYVCAADIDEDDYARMMQYEGQHANARCPFWVNGDEYAVVRHQAF
jgi:hypothetical protein